MATKTNQYKPQIAFHPGETLEEKLHEMKMGPKEFAVRTGKPEKTINAILKGKSSITPEMAVQFEHVLQIPADFWLKMQGNYDEYLARIEQEEIFKESYEWAKQFPLNEMMKKGWIPTTNDINQKVHALLSFFGISNFKAWNNFYFNQPLKLVFRISLAHTKEPYAISAWLRKGELQAAELNAPEYSEEKFKVVLLELKKLMAKHPEDFFEQLQKNCLYAGVKVVLTPCVNKAPINGSTRWLNETPLIQLSGRYKRNDSFWFTFFHEAGHILLHGKKDIFLENIEYSEYDKTKEKEADDFAESMTFTKTEEAEVLKKTQLTEEDVRNFAAQYETHPAMIIGRLHHLKKVPYALGRNLIVKLDFENSSK